MGGEGQPGQHPDGFSSGLTIDVHRLLFLLASTGHRISDKSLAIVFWGAGEGVSESKDCS